MSKAINEFGQLTGPEVSDWQEAKRPKRAAITGCHCLIEPLNTDRHAQDLFDAFAEDKPGQMWTYLSQGPFKSFAEFHSWIDSASQSNDPICYALIDTASGKAVGIAGYARIDTTNGVIEVGGLTYSPLMQKTALATEAMFLMMQNAFDNLGYRRYEWKCDSLNQASCRAAERLGFRYEGLFRQANIYKGRSRDTAWYSIIDSEWPELRKAFLSWLDSDNFDDNGIQKKRLQDFYT